MRLIVTDTGNIWNHENPYLEQFKDIVLVVCLLGKVVTDKYECFVTPYKQIWMGIDKYGVEDQKYRALASVAGKLNSEFRYHDKIVFLTDNEPSSLYPYFAVKDLNKYNSLHLVAMSPWKFEGNRRIKGYNAMLSDLSALSSILYYDSNEVLNSLDLKSTLSEVFDYSRNYLGSIMVKFLNGIYENRRAPSFFDFASMSYIPLESGFDEIDLTKRDTSAEDIKFPLYRSLCTLGVVCPPSYPEDDEYTKDAVERPVASINGKKVCNVLREQRIRLAEANGIPFKSEECPSIGPCAGTCEKCDMESKYLRKQLQKIPEEERVYPQFDPSEEVPV